MGSEDDDDYDPNKFDVSTKIMFAAIFSLLAVVVIIIILHMYARYLLRRQERRQQPASTATQVAPADESDHDHYRYRSEPPGKGLDPTVIASLPKFIHKPSDHGEAIECSICLSAVGEETTVRILPNCKHVFHVECVDIWLSSNTTCPICRTVAEPRVHPTAPPLEDSMPRGDAESEKAGGSGGSRLSSFRGMLTGERSSSRIQSCGGHEVGAEDLER